MPRVPVIGFLTRNLEPNDTYNLKVWRLASTVAVEKGCHLMMLPGQVLGDRETEGETKSALFRLVNPALMDGAILSQTILYRLSPEELRLLDRDVPTLPMVAVTLPLGHRPVVNMDNTVGLRQLIRHLIDHHGFRKIVHVRGPQNNSEAADRERVWREELGASGIQPRPEWLVQGDFDYSLIPQMAQEVLDRAGRSIDAVVACNDMAAFRVMEGFRDLGIRVPEDIAVCGFDDVVTAETSVPPLTTVEQPLGTQVRAAWKMLEGMLAGTPEVAEVVATRAVIRASCGCGPTDWTPGSFPQTHQFADTRRAVSYYEGLANDLRWKTFHLNCFFRDLNRISEDQELPEVLKTWLPRLGFGFFALFRTCSAEGALEPWRSQVNAGELLPGLPLGFRLSCAVPEGGLDADLFYQAAGFSLSSWQVFEKPTLSGLFPLVVQDRWLGLLALELTSEAGLLELNVQDQVATLLYRLHREKLLRLEAAQNRAVAAANEERTQVLSRVVAQVSHEINTPLGAIISSGSTLDRLVKEVSPAEPLGTPSRRADRAERWHATSATTLRLEKTALKTWLLEQGWEPDDEFVDNLVFVGFSAGDPELKALLARPDHERALSDLIHAQDLASATRLISSAAGKINRFVQKLKESAAPEVVEEEAPTPIEDNIRAALLFLGDPWEGTNPIHTEFGTVPPVWCRPHALHQVWINLLRNAQQAVGDQGQIRIVTSWEAPWVRVDVHDDGPGVDPSVRDRLFEPFFTTKLGGKGLGLGLDHCRRILEEAGGKMDCQSVPGDTTFSVWLPTKAD